MVEQSSMHFRRCHICGHLNMQPVEPVTKCRGCAKPLAPFYYFDDRFTAVPSEANLRPPSLDGRVLPIQGLTVYWEST